MRVSVTKIQGMKAKGERIPMLTAYDYPTARLADEVFTVPGRIASRLGRKLAVAFDEFQAIGEFGGARVEQALRAAAQHQREVVLRHRIAGFGGNAVQARRLGKVLQHAAPRVLQAELNFVAGQRQAHGLKSQGDEPIHRTHATQQFGGDLFLEKRLPDDLPETSRRPRD